MPRHLMKLPEVLEIPLVLVSLGLVLMLGSMVLAILAAMLIALGVALTPVLMAEAIWEKAMGTLPVATKEKKSPAKRQSEPLFRLLRSKQKGKSAKR